MHCCHHAHNTTEVLVFHCTHTTAPTALQALSPEQIYKIYQTYIKELSSRLVELNQEGCASDEITAQVEKLTKEVVSAWGGWQPVSSMRVWWLG